MAAPKSGSVPNTAFGVVPSGPLTVLIIGAGIGGLSAAIALRRAGHNVHIFEKSRFANEIGAAIHVGPNASRILEEYGYSNERVGGVPCQHTEMLTKEGKVFLSTDQGFVPKVYGAPWYLVHRVDLHNELKHLALSPSTSPTPPCTLHLSTQVTSIDPLTGTVTHNGPPAAPVCGDLIIGADGIHSTTRQIIFPTVASPDLSGYSALRFVIPTPKLLDDPEVAHFAPTEEHWAMRIIMHDERRIVMYPCRRGELLNFNCVHLDSSREAHENKEGHDASSNLDTLKAVFSDFAPVFHRMFALLSPDDVGLWPLRDQEPLETWIKDRVALLGDACHSMMPHAGQGSGQAIEDAAALGVLFPLGVYPVDVPARLKLYEHVRKARAETIQDLARTFAMGKDGGKPVSPAKVQAFIYSHDVMMYAKQSMSAVFIPESGGEPGFNPLAVPVADEAPVADEVN